MNIKTKIKIKLIIFDWSFNLIMWASILLCAFLNDRVLEAIIFYFCYLCFVYIFPKEYHYRHSKKAIYNVLGCLLWSNIFFWVIIPNLFPLGTSIFFSVMLSILVNELLYKFQDYLDLKKEIANKTINIYDLDEDNLRKYAISKGLGEMMIDTLVLKVIHNYKWVEIQNERNYSKTAIKYHKKRINEILGINL
jgi:hypothetical protein